MHFKYVVVATTHLVMLAHAGGRITVDNEHNHALYGPTASPTMVRLCCV